VARSTVTDVVQPPHPPVRVLIADDQVHFRMGLRFVLEDSGGRIEVVGEAGDGDEAIEQARLLHPDVALLDVRMPGTGGIRAAQAISAWVPNVRILMLTVSDSAEDVALAANAGAAGYLLKERSNDEVIEAVLSIAEGHSWPLAAG
jgi:two-component system nitrate/nitrite response regulator NarL